MFILRYLYKSFNFDKILCRVGLVKSKNNGVWRF